jgi:hypothetical protein
MLMLPRGTLRDVKDDVRRNIDVLAPSGGYLFNAIHNIRADVPTENHIAMRQALQGYGVYWLVNKKPESASTIGLDPTIEENRHSSLAFPRECTQVPSRRLVWFAMH